MFTNNYLLMRKSLFELNAISVGYAGFFYDASGNAQNLYLYGLGASDIGHWMKFARCKEIVGQDPNKDYISNNTYAGVYFGSGSTPTNKSDFALENPITSGLEITNTNTLVWNEVGNGVYEVYTDYVVRNTSESDIVIREVGLFTPAHAGSNPTTSTNPYYLLMERTVLDEPIVIPALQSRLVSYKLTLNQTAV